MIKSEWFITPTAVRQYSRYASISGFNEARRELIRLAREAKFVRDDKGPLQLWAVERNGLDVRFLVSTEVRPEGDKPQLVAVITRKQRYDRKEEN